MNYPRPVVTAQSWLRQPRVLRGAHGWGAIIWACLTAPTVLVWHNSILWIGFMSVYAIVATHWSGWAAGEAAVEAETAVDDSGASAKVEIET